MASGAISIMVKVEDVGGGFKQLSLDADGLRKIMEANVRVTEAATNKMIDFAATVTGIRGAADAFSQLTSGLQSLTSESIAFNDAMRAANTMAGQDAAGFARLKGDVADLAKEIPLARDVLANGLYQVVSNGVPEDNWISFLQTSARSAVGGIADLGQTVTVTSTLIKNYGLEWEAAQEIQDKIQLTAKNGVTSFEQLAQSLPRVAGNAATLGVSVDELMASFATLTGVSGNTAEVSTQLAAIFTALVKPSSQAAEMAASMGIQFNAAAIKAAGGFQNFIAQLDSTVQAYAQANGVLAQEVYGRLFGSAESMRALIPITGELAETFSRNIEAMEGSVGTMDAAFEEMDSTFEAKTQRIKNYCAGVTDAIASVTGSVQPVLNAFAGFAQGAASVFIIVDGLRKLNIALGITKVKTIATNAVFRITALFSKKTALSMEMLAVAEGNATRGAIALKVALRGLAVATGVIGAVWALFEVISYLCGAADDAAESIEELSSADEAYTSAASQAQLQIEEDIAGLKRLMDANADTSAAVAELNERYGYLFGTFSDAIQAYDTLTDKSKLYVKQMGYEAKAAELRRKAAEADVKADIAADKMKGLEDAGQSHNSLQVKKNLTPGHLSLGVGESETVSYETGPYREAREEWEAAQSEAEKYYAELEKIKELSEKNKKALNAEQAATASQVKTDDKPNYTVPKPDKPVPKESIAAIDNQIKDLRLKIDLAIDNESRAELYSELAALEEQKRIIEFNYKFPEVPKRPDILPEIDTTVETDIKKIKPQIIDVSEEIANLGERAKTPTEEAAGAFADLGSSIGGLGNALEIPELNVAGTMAQAIATMVAGYAQATAQSSALGPFGWIAFAAAGLAQLTAIVASVKSLPAFANGGIVGGASPSGDKLVARVNSGEMILNKSQQSRLFSALNGRTIAAPSISMPRSASYIASESFHIDRLRGMLNPVGEPGGEVVFKISGDKLEGVLRRRQNYINRL